MKMEDWAEALRTAPLVTSPVGTGKTASVRDMLMGGTSHESHHDPIWIVNGDGKNAVDVMDWLENGAPAHKEAQYRRLRDAVWPGLTVRARRLHLNTIRWAILMPLTQWHRDLTAPFEKAVKLMTEVLNDYAEKHPVGYRFGDPY